MAGTLQEYAQAVHDIISVNRDAEQGFRGAANAARDPAMKQMFAQYAAQRAAFAVELQTAVKRLGFDTTDPQGVGGMLHASWMSLKAMVTGHDLHGILVETERGEDWALKTYRVAMSKTLTPEIAAIVERQFAEIQAAHDRIRLLRDTTAPPPDEPVRTTPAPGNSNPEGNEPSSGI